MSEKKTTLPSPRNHNCRTVKFEYAGAKLICEKILGSCEDVNKKENLPNSGLKRKQIEI